jgi:hypothetical protein
MVRPYHSHPMDGGGEIRFCNCSQPMEPFNLDRYEKELSRSAWVWTLTIAAVAISLGFLWYVVLSR